MPEENATVLVVDDDPQVRDSIGQLLRSLGMHRRDQRFDLVVAKDVRTGELCPELIDLHAGLTGLHVGIQLPGFILAEQFDQLGVLRIFLGVAPAFALHHHLLIDGDIDDRIRLFG